MKKIALKLFSLLTAAGCLCGCGSQQNKGYVDTSEFIESIENNSDTEKGDYFGGHQFDDRAYNTMSAGFTVNGNYLYYMQMKNLRIDGQSGEVEVVCHKAGCAHSAGSPDCTAYQIMRSPVSSPNGIYYCSENKLCLYDGKDTKVILKNNFCTKYEEEVYPDNKYDITHLIYSGGLLYLTGASFYFTYNPSSGETSEPVVISDSSVMSTDIDVENLYFTTDSAELFIYNVSAKESKKLDDNVWQLDFANGRLYYTKYENGVPMLYSADKNGENAKKILEDCYVNICVTEDYIYYQNYTDPERAVFVCKTDGSEPKKIVFPKKKIIDNNGNEVEEKEDYSVGLVNIISSGASDKVFMISENRIYSFDKGSEKSTLITAEEYFQEFQS